MKSIPTRVTIASAFLAAISQAFQMKQPPPIDLVDGFNWKNPFSSEAISAFQPACEVKASFNALEYTLHELMEPPPAGLKPWAKGLKEAFSGREYPGGWSGLDPHLHGRSLLLMDYDKLPLVVREWIEGEERANGEGKALFAILDKPQGEEDEIAKVVEFPAADKMDRSEDQQRVAIFAPGAIYRILPLWESATLDHLMDLSKYSATPVDGGVIAWVEHSEPQDKDKKMEFKIRSQVLKAKEAKVDQGKGKGKDEGKSASREEL